VRPRPFHQLRHAFATLLIQQGESLAYVRDQLGHHSVSLTVDTYAHLLPGSNRQAVDRLDTEPAPASIRNPRRNRGDRCALSPRHGSQPPILLD
jgi:integrase